MAHDASPAKRQSPPVAASSASAVADLRKRPRRDMIEAIWSLFCSIRFAIVLNLSLAVAIMLGTVIPQMPPGMQDFPDAVQQFVATAEGRYGDFSNVLYWAGFYEVYDSLWFRILIALTVFGIIICTLNRWQPIMRLITQPQVRVSDAFMAGMSERAQFRAVPLSIEKAQALVTSALRKSRYRVLSEAASSGKGLHLYADRDRWSKLVTFVSHAALVLFILTAAGLANAGWREQSVYFYPGQPVNVGHGTDFSVRNDGFSIEYYDGTTVEKEYRNALAVIEDGKVVLTKTIIVNDPLSYEGVTFFLDRYQPVLYVKTTGPAGENVPFLETGTKTPITTTNAAGATLFTLRGKSTEGLPLDRLQFAVPEHIITVDVIYYQDVARAEKENPPVYIRAYVDQTIDAPTFDGFLPRTGPLKLPGYEEYTLTFTKDTATILEAAKVPGLELLALFFLLMAAGFTISLYTTFTRCWVRIAPSEERPGSLDILVSGLAEKNKVSFERDFERLAHRIRDNLATETSESQPAPGLATT